MAWDHIKKYHRDYLEFNYATSFVEKDIQNNGIYIPNIQGRHKIRDLIYEAYNICNYSQEPKGTHKWLLW